MYKNPCAVQVKVTDRSANTTKGIPTMVLKTYLKMYFVK